MGIITGTHLRKAGLNFISYRRYNALTDYVRQPFAGGRIGSGDQISVHTSRRKNCLKLRNVARVCTGEELTPIMQHGSAELSLASNPTTPIRIMDSISHPRAPNLSR